MSDGRTPKISVRGLEKSFGPKRVLDGLDIDCGIGESLVIIGGSGTGKSVLIKSILGLLHPERGSIRIDGVETIDMRRADRTALMHKFGMLFQGAALFELATRVGECRVRADPGSGDGAGQGTADRARKAGGGGVGRRGR